MRFLFKTDYDDDIRLFPHSGYVLSYGTLLALLLIALLLMSGPAVVAGLLMVDSNFLDGARDWFQGPASWLSYLAQGRVILLLPLVGMVARAKEDL